MAKNPATGSASTAPVTETQSSYGPEIDAYLKGWIDVGRRYVYKSDLATKPIIGYPIELLYIETQRFEKPWTCLVVQTSQPTDAVDAAGDTCVVPAGSQVLVTWNVALQRLTEHLRDTQTVPEIMVMPTGKRIKTSKGEMRDFDIRVNPIRKTRASLGLPALVHSDPAVAIPQTAGT